jgi:hypothetical protein
MDFRLSPHLAHQSSGMQFYRQLKAARHRQMRNPAASRNTTGFPGRSARESDSSRGCDFHPERIFRRNLRTKSKNAFARRHHRQLHLLPFSGSMIHLEVQPLAKPWIVNLRPSTPELRRQTALNLQMIQLQFNDANFPGKITTHIPGADMQSCDFATSELRLYYHRSSWISVKNSASRAESRPHAAHNVQHGSSPA